MRLGPELTDAIRRLKPRVLIMAAMRRQIVRLCFWDGRFREMKGR